VGEQQQQTLGYEAIRELHETPTLSPQYQSMRLNMQRQPLVVFDAFPTACLKDPAR
jgi:hypothetical protein